MKNKTPTEQAQHYIDCGIVNAYVHQYKRNLSGKLPDIVLHKMYRMMSGIQQDMAVDLITNLIMSGKIKRGA